MSSKYYQVRCGGDIAAMTGIAKAVLALDGRAKQTGTPRVTAPRLLHPVEEARQRGVPVITFNPMLERGLKRFKHSHSPTEMLPGRALRVST